MVATHHLSAAQFGLSVSPKLHSDADENEFSLPYRGNVSGYHGRSAELDKDYYRKPSGKLQGGWVNESNDEHDYR